MTYCFYGLVALVCLISYFVFSKVTEYLDARRFARAHGCKPVRRVRQLERIIGWDYYRILAACEKNKCLLENTLQRWEEYGQTHSLVVMGNNIVATTDPENVKAILATNFKDFGLGERFAAFSPLLGSGIFTTDGARWEHSRALVRPNFTKSQVADLQTFETHIQHMIRKIPRDGSAIDLQQLFFQLTLDSATEFLFGESVDILRSPEGSEQQKFAEAFDFAQSQLLKRYRLGRFTWFYRNKNFDQACKIVHKFVDRLVFKTLEHCKMQVLAEKSCGESADERYIFLNELAKATQDPRQLRDETLNILLAGRDTTASLLSHTFHILARRPNVWSKLKAEINRLGGKAPDYEMLRNMKYLKYVLNESLRLWPVVPSNGRFALRNTILPRGGGLDGQSPIFIAKGQLVSYSVYAMHRRPDIYGPDAKEFKPERWETQRFGWAYLPFNGGPRICVGQQFALTEASYTIVRLLQEFSDIENRDPRPWAEGLGVTMFVGNGVKVALKPRN